MMRRFYVLLTLLAATICMYGFTVDGLKYEAYGNEVAVTGLENESFSGELVIPESVIYNGQSYKVTAIEAGAFRGNLGITSVTFSNSLEGIYYAAFYQCTNLSSFTIPNSVVHIGLHAFEDTGWYNNQPDGAVYKDNVLLGYKKNKPEGDLIIAGGTRVIADGACFDTDITSVQLPQTVEAIGQQAFQGCWQLSSVTIPNSVKKIEFRAFAETPLKEIYSMIKEPFALADEAFRYQYTDAETYYNRVTLYVPAGTKAKYEATDGWKEFKNIVEMEGSEPLKKWDTFEVDGINYTVTNTNPLEAQVGKYGENLAINQDTTGDIIIPSFVIGPDDNTYLVTSIRPGAFERCKKITSVSIPNTVTIIGEEAFARCTSLTSVNIPDSVITIEFGAFYHCEALPSISLPNTVTSIEERAFLGCYELKEIYSYIESPFVIASGTKNYNGTNLVTNVFEYSNATLYVPVGTKEKYEATEGWKEFMNIVEMTPYDVLDDNSVAAHFLKPNEEGKIEIPETVEIDGKTYTVTEIVANAFKDNKDLTEVTIPGTVTTIGEGAFAGCENLVAIYVYASEPISLTADESRSLVTRTAVNVPSQFEGIDFDACTLYVPIGSEQKYREAEGWMLFTHIVGVENPSGISTVCTEQKGNGVVYSLSGQRLATPRRGLNIIGGKKVVVR